MRDADPLVTIVIPTLNAGAHLDRCLRSIEAQTYDRIETIVVDAYSDDSTPEVAAAHDAVLIRSDDGMSEARNTGIERARGTFLLSIDVDMELEATVVEQCVETYASSEWVGGIVIPERSVGNSYWVNVRDFERSFYEGTVVESARFFPLDLVRRVDGYDEEVTFFEDSTLPQRIERETGLDTSYRIEGGHILHHEEWFRLADWLKKKYCYGKSASTYRAKYCERASEQVHPFHRLKIYLDDPERFARSPTLAAGVLALKSLEFGSMGLGMLSARVIA